MDDALLIHREEDRHFGALDQFVGGAEEGGSGGWRLNAHLAEDAAQQVDALGAALLPGLAQAMQLLQLLLLVTLHRHRMDAGAARGFENGIAVVAVGLVAPPAGLHVARMQQGHPMPQRLGETSPIVRGATGLHQPLDRLGLLLYISAKRLAIQPLALTHLTGTDAHGNLVNGLGQIHCNLFGHRCNPPHITHGTVGADKCGAGRVHHSTQIAHFVRPVIQKGDSI
ncbi:hypothetical protein GCM10027514_33340 [Azotobacter armeniacus]